jgi:abequosyltransferase
MGQRPFSAVFSQKIENSGAVLKKTNLLSIAIPTFNRCEFLDFFIEHHIGGLKELDISLLISDNASTDSTREVVEKWQREYENIFYFRNSKNIGEINFEKALMHSKSTYTWLVGDTYKIDRQGLEKVVKLITNAEHIDLVVVNGVKRVSGYQSQLITNPNEALRELGWHMTMISTTIYHKSFLSNMNFKRYYDTYFIHLGATFEAIAQNELTKIEWIADEVISGIKLKHSKKVSWEKEALEIWLNRWPKVILSLPSKYTLENKIHTIRCHNKYSGLLSMRNLIKLRSENFISIKKILKFKAMLVISVPGSEIIKIMAAAIIPQAITKMATRLIGLTQNSHLIPHCEKSCNSSKAKIT